MGVATLPVATSPNAGDPRGLAFRIRRHPHSKHVFAVAISLAADLNAYSLGATLRLWQLAKYMPQVRYAKADG